MSGETDIVARLREAAGDGGGYALTVHVGLLIDALYEIERLRGGWTRLADELPPECGPFELRLSNSPDRYVLAWDVDRERYYGGKFGPAGGYLHEVQIPPSVLRNRAGWWRLLPDDEPPAEGRA
jgi:hypothetical protein